MVTRPKSQDEPQGGDAPEKGLHALVLAAGAGTRMGGGKLRREWRGRPLLSWALDAAMASPVERVWLVVGADEDLAELAPEDARLTIVSAQAWKTGLSASLKAGIAALPDTARAALIFLGDMPLIPEGMAGRLIKAWGGGSLGAAPTWAGRRGHPVLLDSRLFPQIDQLEGDAGAGKLLAGLEGRIALVSAPDAGVLFDVDTPQMLEA